MQEPLATRAPGVCASGGSSPSPPCAVFPVLLGEFGVGRCFEGRTAIGVQPRPQASQASHQHSTHGHVFVARDQNMASLMDGNAAQACLSARKSFRQNVAPPPPKTGRIQGQSPEG